MYDGCSSLHPYMVVVPSALHSTQQGDQGPEEPFSLLPIVTVASKCYLTAANKKETLSRFLGQ